MKITFEMDNKYELAGDVMLAACDFAYKTGKENFDLTYVGFMGCEKNKNFTIIMEINEL
jgi:hypothetical protein